MQRKDKIAFIGLGIMVILVLLPMLTGWLGIFFDDFYEVFPRLYFNAKSIQNGTLPLWDPHVFAGGRVNYIPNTRIWYWPLYPFYLICPLGNISAAFIWLIKIPLLLHWLICIFAAYGLGRKVIALCPLAAAVLAIVYSFGAGLTGNISDPQTMYSVMWVPLAILGIVEYAKGGNRIMGIMGAFAIAFIGSCGSDVRAIYSLMTVAIAVIIFLGVNLLFGSGKPIIRFLLRVMIVFIIGILLSGPYWVAMGETISIYRGTGIINTARSASSSSSTPWSYLNTLLMPDLYGTLTNSSHIDPGIPEISDYWHIEGNLTGGYWLMLLSFSGGLAIWRCRYRETAGRCWLVGFLLFIFSIFLVTGKYSPVYPGLVRVLPIFGLPYAVRWRIMEHLGIAIMAGSAVQVIRSVDRPLSRLLLSGFLLCLLLGVFLQMSRFTGYGMRYITYAWANHPNWLLSSPIPYLLGGIILTVFLAVIYRRPEATYFLIWAVIVESTIAGFAMIYFLTYRCPDIGDTRYRSPTDTILFRQGDYPGLNNSLSPKTGPGRTTFFNSMIDQMATLHGGDYLGGMCSKPLIPRIPGILEEVVEGYPYELVIENPGSRFFPNMSVRYMILEHPGLISEEDASVTRLPDKDLPGKLYNYRLRFTMPRVFVQDRVVLCSPDQAKYELINRNLRRGAFVEDSELLFEGGNSLTPVTDYKLFNPGSEQEVIEHFNELQKANKINRVWFSKPNRMEIDIEVADPVLLITTDVFHPGWEVKVDGEKKQPLPINYIQRGVWLTEGRHLVEWIFCPSMVIEGFIYLGLGLISLIVLMVFPSSRDNKK